MLIHTASKSLLKFLSLAADSFCGDASPSFNIFVSARLKRNRGGDFLTIGSSLSIELK